MKIASLVLLLASLGTVLPACSSQSRVSDSEGDSGAGPTVYGQLSVSVDYVDAE